jgi:hypothetical protein
VLLELPDARGDVRLDPIELDRRAHHAAFFNDRVEYSQGFEINRSHAENNSAFLFI